MPDRECIIGRQSATVQLTDNTVSRIHARLTLKDGRWTLEDAGSANGTYLNGVKVVKPMPIKRGDQIRCGSTLLVFGGQRLTAGSVDLDENGNLVDAAIVATVPSNEDSVIIPTPEAGAQAIGNLRILYDLISETGLIFNIDQLLQRTLDKVFDILKADRGYVMLEEESGNGGGRNGKGGKLALRASRLAEGSSPKDIPISRTIINEVMSKQIGVLSSNAMGDKRFTSGRSVHDFGIRSAICVPIKGRSRILGVIHVDCSISEHTYSTEQLRLLTAIGYQTGLAIENVRLYEAAVQSERLTAVGETVSYLSHHTKNILQALSGGIDLVEMGLKEGSLPKAKEAWPIVQRNLQRINDLILNMLAFSKDRQPLLESINVNYVIRECLDLVGPRADERGVAILSDLDDLPPIPGDSGGLHQVFMNLLTNGLDAVADDTGTVTVTSQYDSMNRNVVVLVGDNGPGIPAGQLEKIFTPFWSTKGQSGTGLGLAVTRKIVQEHRGRIEVKSKVGEGATFIVTLPAIEGGDSGETRTGPAGK